MAIAGPASHRDADIWRVMLLYSLDRSAVRPSQDMSGASVARPSPGNGFRPTDRHASQCAATCLFYVQRPRAASDRRPVRILDAIISLTKLLARRLSRCWCYTECKELHSGWAQCRSVASIARHRSRTLFSNSCRWWLRWLGTILSGIGPTSVISVMKFI